jgi:serine/threonine-protein kinase RsbW
MANLRLVVDLDTVAEVRQFVVEVGRDLGLAPDAMDALELAVEEACANVCRHAYGGHCGEIELTLERGEGSVEVVLRDWGAPFDPGAVRSPDLAATLEERSLGGLGLYLMQKLMDRVEFQFDGEGGNTLTMVKQLSGAGDVVG